MKKQLNNERGAALVLTVIIISLLLVTLLGLSTQVIQTNRQVATTEENMDAELIAQMGIDYYIQAFTEGKSELKTKLDNAILNEKPIKPVFSQYVKEVKDKAAQKLADAPLKSFEVTEVSTEGTVGEGDTIISIKSVGTNGSRTATATSTFTMNITIPEGSGD